MRHLLVLILVALAACSSQVDGVCVVESGVGDACSASTPCDDSAVCIGLEEESKPLEGACFQLCNFHCTPDEACVKMGSAHVCAPAWYATEGHGLVDSGTVVDGGSCGN